MCKNAKRSCETCRKEYEDKATTCKHAMRELASLQAQMHGIRRRRKAGGKYTILYLKKKHEWYRCSSAAQNVIDETWNKGHFCKKHREAGDMAKAASNAAENLQLKAELAEMKQQRASIGGSMPEAPAGVSPEDSMYGTDDIGDEGTLTSETEGEDGDSQEEAEE